MTTPKVFRFKQFSVDDCKCAMKVGTDAVILGAWANVINAETILDIGTGCGLIALMAAQRSRAHVKAIEINEAATLQCRINFAASPWNERIEAIHGAVQQYRTDRLFDFIICNPPFFKNAMKTPDPHRNIARHNDQLSFESLLFSVDRLLKTDGTFAYILPVDEAQQVMILATAYQLYPVRICTVYSREDKSPNRLMVELSRKASELINEKLIIRDLQNKYTPRYIGLTEDFYLFLSE